MNLPGYDEWKTRNPDDERCEHCGCSTRRGDGWQPPSCTGECGIVWRDPDEERETREDWHDWRSL